MELRLREQEALLHLSLLSWLWHTQRGGQSCGHTFVVPLCSGDACSSVALPVQLPLQVFNCSEEIPLLKLVQVSSWYWPRVPARVTCTTRSKARTVLLACKDSRTHVQVVLCRIIEDLQLVTEREGERGVRKQQGKSRF